jgi:class 3 adenylate cyclase
MQQADIGGCFRMQYKSHAADLRRDLAQRLHPFAGDCVLQHGETSEVAAGLRHARNKTTADRIGVLIRLAASDPQGQAAMTAFRQALQQLGWRDGQNVTIDVRWSQYDLEDDRRYAAELVALAPDVILASGTLSVAAQRS